MSKCCMPKCPNEAAKGRMLCSQHYALGVTYRANGVCLKCPQRLAADGSTLCIYCQQETKDEMPTVQKD